MSTAVAVTEEPTTQALTLLEHRPVDVLADARTAAVALQGVISQKAKKVVMNGEQYLEFEDWQTLGRFYGITAKEDGDPEFVYFSDDAGATVRGFKASAVALDKDGREITRATAYCLSDEEKWGSRPKYEWAYLCKSGGHSVEDPGKDELIWEFSEAKGKKLPKREKVRTGDDRVPLFQLASMAQTRAAAKAMRNVLSWVAVLAGYRPTPAEEIADIAGAHEETNGKRATPVPAPIEAQVVGREPGGDDAEVSGEPPRVRVPAPGSPALEDPAALGAECLRLVGGNVKGAGTLLATVAGVRSARGMKGDAVRAAWDGLSKHPTFGSSK
jgi:hypothetical protein